MREELEYVLGRFCEAWNRHDPELLAQLWADDGELNHPWGFRAVGREAIRELLEKEHRGAMASSSMRLDIRDSRVSEDTAFADVDGVLENVAAPNGKPYTLSYELSAMFRRVGGDWRIRTMTPVANPR